MHASRGIVCLATAASACYTAVAKDNVPCASNGDCPVGQSCDMGGVCRGSDFVPPPDAAADAPSALFALSGQHWLLPCEGAGSGSNNLCACDDIPEIDTIALTGSSTVYQVTVRIRGVLELAPYTGGMASATGNFYTGGLVNSSYGNVYKMTVSSPMAYYFINNAGTGNGGLVAVDYMATLPIAGDANITFDTDGQDGMEAANSAGLTVPDVTTDPQPYDGQFAQLDVISAM